MLLLLAWVDTMDTVKVMFGRWVKKATAASKKGQEYAGDMWQHCMFLLDPSFYIISKEMLLLLSDYEKFDEHHNV